MQQKPPPLAKITRPSLPGFLPRKRLFRLLDRRRKRPITWITGPPGSGKTTLVSSYLEDRKRRHIWYHLDEGDEDIATFFYYMGLAAKKAAPHRRRPLPLLTPEYLQGISTFTRRYFEDLFGRLKLPFTVVIDNYQKMPEGSNFHEVIRDGLSAAPEGVSVIFISRSAPPPEMSCLLANRAMAILGWDELRLTLEESNGIISLLGETRFSKEMVRQLHDRADGWMAGLVLMLEQAETGDPALASLTETTPGVIFDYFAGEVFQRTDSNTREFLLKTSFLSGLSGMTARMAAEFTGQRRAGRILSDLCRQQYFTLKHGHSEPTYQYHPLFREFLQFRAKEMFTPAQRISLQCNAAMVLETAGRVEDAAGLYLEACNWERSAQLICKYAPSLMSQGRGQTVDRWLSALPEEFLDNTPWLLYWLGACRMPFNPPQSLTYFDRAFIIFKTQKDSSGTFLAWSGAVTAIYYMAEDLSLLDHWIAVFDELLLDYNTFPSPGIEIRVSSSIFVTLSSRQPHHPDMGMWAERVLSLSQKNMDTGLRVYTTAHLAYYYIWIGDYTKARVVIDTFQKSAISGNGATLEWIVRKTLEAIYYVHTGRYEPCLRAVAEGLETARTIGVHIYDYHLLGQRIAMALCEGDFASAAGGLREMAPVLEGHRSVDKSFYHYLTGWCAWLQGNILLAYRHAEIALRFARELGYPLVEALCHLMVAQILYDRPEVRKAKTHLSKACRIARMAKSRSLEFTCLLTEAQLTLDLGKDAAGKKRRSGETERRGLKALRQAMKLGREQGYVNFYGWNPTIMTDLCIKALEAGIEVEYVQYLIRRRYLMPDPPPLECERWPWALKIYTLGRFGLIADGKPIRLSGRVQRRPLDLLKALLAFGGRGVSKEELTDALWPEADGDAAHRSFITTLQRLRSLLGHKEAIQFREGQLSLDPRTCWVDAWTFERLIGQAASAAKQGQTDRAAGLVERAMVLYQGVFLHGDPSQPWAVSFSERLHNKFLRYLGEICHALCQTKQCKRVVVYYQKGLEVDDLAEELYQGLMKCYQCLGYRARALTVYNRCRRTLAAAFGVEPSPETEAIYKMLKCSDPE